MTELDLLRVLLLLSLAIAPFGTHRVFLRASRVRTVAGVLAWGCAAAALFSSATFLAAGWLLFTAGTFAEFLVPRRRRLREFARAPELAATVPFLFSNIAAVWLVGGTNDLHILGYGPHFSFYAALHGNVLGWTSVGALAILASRAGPHRRLYAATVLVALVSFLVIAIGIDQLRAIKATGVVGLSLAIPLAELALIKEAWSRHKVAAALGLVSLATLLFTMVLAWRSEVGALAFPAVAGVRGMVAVHGVLNTLVVGPSLLAAAVALRG